MLELVKKALRISTTAYDTEIQTYIDTALRDLAIAGVYVDSPETDKLIATAVITYARMRFGSPENYEQLKRAYDEQKAQLMTATDYTDWGGEQ